jgi:hypothetical protein
MLKKYQINEYSDQIIHFPPYNSQNEINKQHGIRENVTFTLDGLYPRLTQFLVL